MQKEIEILKEKKEFKNYNELCKYLSWSNSRGKQRDLNFKKLSKICEYEKMGHKILIRKVYENPKETYKKDKIDYSKLKVSKNHRMKAGIYKISNDKNEVYIGSTVCLRNRFIQHKNGHHLNGLTREILNSTGGKMELLQEIDIAKYGEKVLRDIELLYIKEYLRKEGVNCINTKNTKLKKESSPITKEQQIKVCELLLDNLKNTDLELTQKQYSYIVKVLGGQANE